MQSTNHQPVQRQQLFVIRHQQLEPRQDFCVLNEPSLYIGLYRNVFTVLQDGRLLGKFSIKIHRFCTSFFQIKPNSHPCWNFEKDSNLQSQKFKRTFC